MVGRVPGGAAAAANPPIESGLFHRAAGVLRRPRATLADVAAGRPRWAGVLALSSAAASLASGLFSVTAVGRQALVDQWERTAFAFGQELDDAGYAQLVELGDYSGLYGVASALAVVAGLSVAVAIALFATLPRRDGLPGFRQVLAVMAHASVILAVRFVVAAPVGYVRETAANATSVGNWVQLFAQGSSAGRVLALLDVVIVWWAAVAGYGIARLYGRRPGAMVLAFVGGYVGLALLLAGIAAAMSSG